MTEPTATTKKLPMRAQTFSAQERLHYLRRAAQRCVKLARIFAAGFGHVGPSAAGAADFLRQLCDDFSGLNSAGQIFRHAHSERNFSILLHAAENDYAGA